MQGSVDPWDDFAELCDLGGRLCGTPAEQKARAVLTDRLQALAADHGGRFASIPLKYDGWRAGPCQLQLEGTKQAFEVYPLLHSPATGGNGLTAEIVDLGRGAEADFEARGSQIPDRIVVVAP